MIVGSPLLREHGIFFDGKWISGGKYEPLIGEHYLGKIWWGQKSDACSSPMVCTAQEICNKLEDLEENWELNKDFTAALSDKNERFDENMLHNAEIQDLKRRYYEDQLVVKANCEESTTSKEDEAVLEFYNKSVTEVTDRGRKRIQLPLPWKYPDKILGNNALVAESTCIVSKQKQ